MNFTNIPPPYPLSAFHLAAREAAGEVIRHVQAPDALVGMAFLKSMSASAQGLYDVRLPTGQIRPISLNLLMVADSGERKSGVDDLASAPIYAFDQLRMKKYGVDVEKYELEMRIWKSVDAGLRRQITKLTQEGQSIDELCCRLSEHATGKPIKPRLRRIMRQNATERAIMDALEGDGESIAFMSDEGEIIIKGGALNQTGTLNKTWDGAAMLALDRSDGVSIVVRNPRVTVAYMVQRKVLKELLDRRGDVLRGSGHWARYLIGCPASTQGTRYAYQLDTTWTHLPKFQECMRELLDEFGRRIDADAIERTILDFSEDAIARWIELANQVESMLSPWGYLHDIKDFASKAVEIISRVAVLLHVFSKQEGKISVDTLNRAVTIVEWHIHEFKRLFSPNFAIPQEQADAQVLEHYLLTHYWRRNYKFAQRNLVLRNGPVRPASRLDAALNCMIAAGRVRITVGPKRERYIELSDAYFGSLGGGTAF
jgi:hypothetical protein